MAIPRNKNITKQLNSYSYVIAITLQGLLQRTKRALSDELKVLHLNFLLPSHEFFDKISKDMFSLALICFKTQVQCGFYTSVIIGIPVGRCQL
jgi:hypothetical protein